MINNYIYMAKTTAAVPPTKLSSDHNPGGQASLSQGTLK